MNEHSIVVEMGEALGYQSMEDWYKLSADDVKECAGHTFLKKYNHSPFLIIQTFFPNYTWFPWKMKVTPLNSWNDNDIIIKYIKWLGNILGYTCEEDWYRCSDKEFKNNYGSTPLSKYGKIQLLRMVYPDYEWLPWKFKRVARNTWDNKEIITQYIKWLGKILGYTCEEDWYKCTDEDFKKNYGCTPLSKYGKIQLLSMVYPDHKWLPWKFKMAPLNTWKDITIQKQYMKWLENKKGYKCREDWYKITQKDFANNYGHGMINEYNGSPIKVLQAIFPENEWLPWKFKTAPQGTWKDITIQRKCMELLGKQLGYTSLEDWYNITRQKIIESEYGSILNEYNGSPISILQSIYPEYKWLPWKFKMAPLNTWKDITQQKQYIEWLGKELGYKSMEDWYKITKDDFSKNYGGGFLQTSYNNNYQELFKAIFPEYKWLPWKFNLTPKNYFTKQENLQSYMKWLGKELEYNTMEDWYNLTTPILEKHYGYSLLTLYNYSVPSILKHTYPDYSWVTYKFICVPNGYWKKKSNRFHYMEFLRDRLGYKTLDDFYNISCELLSNNYGGTLLNYYNSNPIHILLDVYPEYNWDITKFNKRYSNMSTEVMSFIENLFGIHIQHGIDEYKIPDTRYSVDGFHKETNTIYEFHGDFWHGAEYLQIQHAKNNKIHELLKQRFGRTKLREQFIKNKGYNLIVIWEHEWYNGDALSNLYNKILFE